MQAFKSLRIAGIVLAAMVTMGGFVTVMATRPGPGEYGRRAPARSGDPEIDLVLREAEATGSTIRGAMVAGGIVALACGVVMLVGYIAAGYKPIIGGAIAGVPPIVALALLVVGVAKGDPPWGWPVWIVLWAALLGLAVAVLVLGKRHVARSWDEMIREPPEQ